jgi:hypothetical protein
MNRLQPRLFLILVPALTLGALLDHAVVAYRNAIRQPAVTVQPAATVTTTLPTAPGPGIADAMQSVPPAAAAAMAPKSLSAILAERDPRQRTSDLEAFINNLGRGEYGDALKRIRRIPGSNERDLASRLLVARWVQTDPEAALNFAASNRGFEYIADDVFQTEAAGDVQMALERAKGLPDSDLRYMALRGVLSFMADTDPAGALRLAQSLGEFPGNEPLSSMIYRQWATNDPQAAALQAMQQGADNSWRSPVYQVARTWANADPTAAANWSIGLTDPQAQARSIGQVMRQWTREDVTAAANWVNALPQGGTYDAAAAALATSLAGNDPQSAVNWAQNIADTAARNGALERISREIMWRDPANGAAVLQAAGVPPNLIPVPRPPGSRGR